MRQKKFIFDRSLKPHKIAEYSHLKMYHMKMLKMFADISEYYSNISLINYVKQYHGFRLNF